MGMGMGAAAMGMGGVGASGGGFTYGMASQGGNLFGPPTTGQSITTGIGGTKPGMGA